MHGENLKLIDRPNFTHVQSNEKIVVVLILIFIYLDSKLEGQ